MPKYEVSGMVTISISGTVEADSPGDARYKAARLAMPDLCDCCTQPHGADEETWDVDALDGEACSVSVEGVEDD